MKMILLCVLILGTLSLYAQEQREDVQNLPVLQEWYSWKGDVNTGPTVSYLPGFDSLGGGLNAITQGRTGDRVWYNRFPLDTAEQFRWKNQGSYAVVQIDFNNDGIHDYIDAKGRIYAGIKKGTKPNPEPVRTFSRGNINNPFVGDMNGDGFQDILMWNSMVDCEIDFGAKEWSSMKRTILHFPMSGKYSQYISGYMNKGTEPRIIIYTLRDYFEGFYLYGIRTENKGDSVHVFLDELDKIEISKLYKDEPTIYDATGSGICTSNQKILFEVHHADFKKTEIFNISNDKMKLSNTFDSKIVLAEYLQGSIDGDEEGDYIGAYEGEPFVFFDGFPDKNLVPVMRMPVRDCGFTNAFRFIGDVNNDGVGDLAYGSQGCFSIYLGLNWRTVGTTTEYTNPSFIIQQNEPNPVSKDRQSVLPISLKKAGIYALHLYDIRGAKIKTLFEGFLNSGEVKLPLDLIGLSVGTYILKMTDGKQVRERAIIISE